MSIYKIGAIIMNIISGKFRGRTFITQNKILKETIKNIHLGMWGILFSPLCLFITKIIRKIIYKQ
jgi:hypothetical protein